MIKRDVMTRDFSEGGLRMMQDIQSFIEALKVKRVIIYMAQ